VQGGEFKPHYFEGGAYLKKKYVRGCLAGSVGRATSDVGVVVQAPCLV